MKMQEVKIRNLVPNPYRNIEDYPIDKDKVDLLVKSFERTGFWGNIVTRKVGTKFQIAFGHHRLEALIKLFGKNASVYVVVQNLTNEKMLQMMAAENLEEYGHSSAFVEMETIEQTIAAYDRGEIKLPEVPKDTNKKHIRHARNSTFEPPFTKLSVATFLDWTSAKGTVPDYKCKVAFYMMDAVDLGIVTRDQLRGIRRQQADEIVQHVMSIKRAYETLAKEKRAQAEDRLQTAETQEGLDRKATLREAKRLKKEAATTEAGAITVSHRFADHALEMVRSGEWAVRDVRKEANEEKALVKKQIKKDKAKTARKHIDNYTKKVSMMLNKNDKLHASMVEILEGDYELNAKDTRKLQKEVDGLITRATKFWDALEEWEPELIEAK